MTSPDDTVAGGGDSYSDLLVQYHRSLLSGDAGSIDATPSDDFSGAANALRMIERNRQLTSSGDSTLPSGGPVSRAEASRGKAEPNRIGRFEILRRLGSGGSGAVLLARDPELNREVALKVPLPDALLRDEFVERFQREARLAARLRHPHIVSVLETGSVGPIHFIATDFCNGPNLDQWLKEHNRPVAPVIAARLIRALADATQHAHSRGILHRDIKPSNILCSRGNGDRFDEEELPECVRLADFGLAKSVTDESQVTSPAAILGTPAYMAPEQASGEVAAIGTHSDVFSLGIVLYQMLTNVSPFERETPLATLAAIKDFEPKPPRTLVRGIPADLEAICMKCLAKRVDDRYQTAAALADDLGRFLANRPVQARRISTFSLLRRWANRNPAIAGLLCLLCLGTVAAGGVIVQSHRETLDALEGAVDAQKSAEANATLARKAVYEARLATADSLMLSGQGGQRVEAIASLVEARKTAQTLRYGEPSRVELRNKAITATSLYDVEPIRVWGEGEPATTISASGALYATLAEDGHSVTIRTLADDKEYTVLQMPGDARAIGGFVFSPTDRYLAMRASIPPREDAGILWNLETQEVLAAFHVSFPWTAAARRIQKPFDFSPDESLFLYCFNRELHSVELANMNETITPFTYHLYTAKFSPSGDRFAIAGLEHGSRLQVFNTNDFDSGEPLHEFDFTERATHIAWSPDETMIVAGKNRGDTFFIWSLKTGTLLYELGTGGGQVRDLAFHPLGRWLMTSCMDGWSRLWDVSNGRRMLKFNASATHFVDAGEIATRNGPMTFHAPLGTQVPAVQDPDRSAKWLIPFEEFAEPAFHPTGRIVAMSEGLKIVVRDMQTWESLIEIPDAGGRTVFSSDGSGLFAQQAEKRIVRIPVSWHMTDETTEFRFGKPRLQEPEPIPADWPKARSRVKRRFRLFGNTDATIHFVDCDTGLIHVFKTDGRRDIKGDISSDGEYIAAGYRSGPEVVIWRLRTGEEVGRIPLPRSRVRFHPGSHTLACMQAGHVTFFRPDEAGAWRRVGSYGELERSWPRYAGFSDDGSLFVGPGPTNYQTNLIDPVTLKRLATIELADQRVIRKRWLSPDARYFINEQSGSDPRVWDLGRIRSQLSEMELDWDGPRPEIAAKPQTSLRCRSDW